MKASAKNAISRNRPMPIHALSSRNRRLSFRLRTMVMAMMRAGNQIRMALTAISLVKVGSMSICSPVLLVVV